ncbi:secretion system protein [Pseudomonas dryadis]|uniref:Secretion system protein n=2 Tax=Pseudomonadales TaxID=72274 RepID=A0ABY1Z6H7_9GAMM|nr:secretion system protein [Pseudomonas dryadis]TBV15533.1 secretion system protein [Pseudomonas sp. FRB 230]
MMDAVLDLLTLLVFVAVILAVLAARSLSGRGQNDKAVTQRLRQLKEALDGPRQHTGDRPTVEGILLDMQRTPFAELPVLGPRIARVWLGLSVLGWQNNLGMRVALTALASLMIGVLLGRETPLPLLAGLLLSLLAFVVLAMLGYRNGMAKHLRELRQSLPEAIDAVTRTARAGVPVSNAFALVGPNLSGPLALEFALIDNWLRLGVPLRQAMQDSARRIPLNEYRFFAVILIINQEAGGRLGETLDRLSTTLRDRQELHLKIQAKTSEARASAKIVASLVPFALGYMYLNSPKDFHFLLNDPTGNVVLFYAFGSVALGLTLTHLMVRRVS